MKLETITNSAIGFVLGVIVCSILSYFFNNKVVSSPVEETITIDSLIKVNDSIKLKVEYLDSIKNAKVIEVSTLDNDSTLKLFYKLVKE